MTHSFPVDLVVAQICPDRMIVTGGDPSIGIYTDDDWTDWTNYLEDAYKALEKNEILLKKSAAVLARIHRDQPSIQKSTSPIRMNSANSSSSSNRSSRTYLPPLLAKSKSLNGYYDSPERPIVSKIASLPSMPKPTSRTNLNVSIKMAYPTLTGDGPSLQEKFSQSRTSMDGKAKRQECTPLRVPHVTPLCKSKSAMEMKDCVETRRSRRNPPPTRKLFNSPRYTEPSNFRGREPTRRSSDSNICQRPQILQRCVSNVTTPSSSARTTVYKETIWRTDGRVGTKPRATSANTSNNYGPLKLSKSVSNENEDLEATPVGAATTPTSREKVSSGVSTPNKFATPSGSESDNKKWVLAGRTASSSTSSIIFNQQLDPSLLSNEKVNENLNRLDSPDWEQVTKGLAAIVNIARQRPELLKKEISRIHDGGLKQLASPRSKVSREACCFFREMFSNLGRTMETGQDVDRLMDKLLDKSVDTNKFLQQDAWDALAVMVEKFSHGRIIRALSAVGVNHRNAGARKTAAQLVKTVVDKIGPQKILHEYPEKTIHMLVGLLQEGNQATRTVAKSILGQFLQDPRFDSLLKRHVEIGELQKISKVIESVSSEVNLLQRTKSYTSN